MSETTSNVVDSAVAQEAFASEVTGKASSAQQETVAPVTDSKSGYTEVDLQRVREQEKSKLYPQIDSLKEEINLLKKDREAQLAEAVAIAKEKEEAARKLAESEMDVRSLLEKKEQEWESKLEEIRQEGARKDALLERERQYAELTAYRNRRLAEEQENIMPELLDLISGNNADEIENSITGLRERSSKILESAQQAMQTARRDMKGTSTTLPPTMENNSGQQQFTADQIAAMSVTEYAKYRDRLFPGANNQNKGLFG
jgi:sugar-specific transcriptional regulator TrmB